MTGDEAFMVMTRVQRKIEDRSGASLSVALLFFLVCAIVGSILIAAASVSMGRMKNISEGEQDRYAIDSAMELIAKEMGEGEVTFKASMFANDPDPEKRILVQSITTGGDEDEDSDEDESNDDTDENEINDNGYQKDVFDNMSLWRLQIRDSEIIDKSQIKDFGTLRDYIAQTIFRYYLDKTSGNILSTSSGNSKGSTDLLGIWNPSDDDLDILKDELNPAEDTDVTTDYLDEFFFKTPGTAWNDKEISKTEYQYISVKSNASFTSGIEEDPIVLQIGDNVALKVNVLIAMDTQFNISVVIYPYDNENVDHPDHLKDANAYRVVTIHCEKSDLSFDTGEEPDEIIEDTDGRSTTNKYARHGATLNIKWGKAEKASVIANDTASSNKNLYFFPKQFKDLLTNDKKVIESTTD